MQEVQSQSKKERRKPASLLIYLVSFGWLLFVASLAVAHFARPELNTGLVRYWNIQIRDTWQPELTQILLYLLYIVVCLSALGLYLNKRYSRRKDDRIHLNIIALFLCSLCLTLYLAVKV